MNGITHGLIEGLRVLVPFGYLLAVAGYVRAFVKDAEQPASWVRPVTLTGIGLHTVLLLLLFMEDGFFPFGTVVRGLFFCSWAVAVLFYAADRIFKEVSYGTFFLPLHFLLTLFTTVFLNHGVALPRPMMSYFFVIHVSMLFTAYAFFLFSFVVSIMYLLQYAGIKRRKPGPLLSRLPSLETMDHSVRVMDAMGLSLTVLGIITGFMWLDAFNMPLSSNIPVKAGFIMLTFIIYLGEHLLRIGRGWKGQRACLMSIAGFLFVLCTLIVGRHGY